MDFNNYIKEVKELHFNQKLINDVKESKKNNNIIIYFFVFSFFVFFYFQTIISHSFFETFKDNFNSVEYKLGFDLLLFPLKDNLELILNHPLDFKELFSSYINNTFINIYIFISVNLVFDFTIKSYKSKKIEVKKIINSFIIWTVFIFSLYITSFFFLNEDTLIKISSTFELSLYLFLLIGTLVLVCGLISSVYLKCLDFYLSFRNINDEYVKERNKRLDNIIHSLLKNDAEMLNIISYHYNKKKMVENFKERDLNLINDELLNIIEKYKKNIGHFKTEEEVLKDSILNKNKNESEVLIINE